MCAIAQTAQSYFLNKRKNLQRLCGRRKAALVHLPLVMPTLLIRSILSPILSALQHTLEFAEDALSILKLAKVKGHLMK